MNIAVLVSGGVDSSVALKLLKDEGHAVTAFYLKIWLEDETAFLGECPWEEDLRYVRAVCKKLDVPLKVVPLQREYHDRVISYALEEVRVGRTPNPDVMCNSFIKFGAFVEWLDTYINEGSHPLCPSMDSSPSGRGKRLRKGIFFDKVATGHYARVAQVIDNKQQKRDGSSLLTPHYNLLTAKDPVKDQTYFLSRLTQDQLSRALFPLGAHLKTEIRDMANKWNLPTKSRPDSQGLCFLGKINYSDFVRHHLGEKDGDIINSDTGEVVGRHRGYWLYTIGQRHGLDLSGGPWYVTGKDTKENVVFISHRLKMTTVERDTFEVANFRFLVPEVQSLNPSLQVKIRHGAQQYECSVEFLDNEKTRLCIKLLNHKERGIAPGQFAVLYDGEVCLGSGSIQ